MAKRIPLSRFEVLVKKALGLIKNSGRSGIYQARLLQNMANGGGTVPEEVVSDLFMVLQEYGVHKAFPTLTFKVV